MFLKSPTIGVFIYDFSDCSSFNLITCKRPLFCQFQTIKLGGIAAESQIENVPYLFNPPSTLSFRIPLRNEALTDSI
jgi:hypothetical protein